MKNIWKNGIMGVIVGDALGCPVQFESREEVARHPVMSMRGYGTFNLPAGSWTDDSSLTLALLESIKRLGGIDYTDIMNNFVKWLDDGEFTPYGYAYDIGRGTMSAVNRYKRYHKPHKSGNIDERSNGNGSLMRIMPAVLYCIEHELSPLEEKDDEGVFIWKLRDELSAALDKTDLGEVALYVICFVNPRLEPVQNFL